MAINKIGGPGGIDRPDQSGNGPGSGARRANETETPREDRVELSPAARSVLRLADLARELPEIREGRVRELRERVDAGEYQIDPRRLARAIFEFEDGIER